MCLTIIAEGRDVMGMSKFDDAFAARKSAGMPAAGNECLALFGRCVAARLGEVRRIAVMVNQHTDDGGRGDSRLKGEWIESYPEHVYKELLLVAASQAQIVEDCRVGVGSGHDGEISFGLSGLVIRGDGAVSCPNELDECGGGHFGMCRKRTADAIAFDRVAGARHLMALFDQSIEGTLDMTLQHFSK